MASSTDAELDPEALERLAGLAGQTLVGDASGSGLRVGVACARFNGAITTRLLEGCLAELVALGVDRRDVTVAWVPGAFELPVVARALATAAKPADAVICLGAVIRGETGHYEAVVQGCTHGLTQVATATGVPVILGVLTCETLDQALARSQDDETNKGREAASAAVSTARLLASAALRG